MKNTIKKNKEGYGYKYTELAEINKYCMENGITYYQEIETSEINQKDYIITYLVKNIAHIEKEKTIVDEVITKHRGCQIVDAVLSGIKNPVQEYGSSLTYCRRYSLLMALGLATEDDDAQGFTIKKEATEDDAKKWVFTYGKYKGQTMDSVINEDLQYVEWYIKDRANDYDKKCYEILTGVKLPTEEELDKKLQLIAEFEKLIIETNTAKEKIYETYRVKNNTEMSIKQLEQAIRKMKSKEVK